MNNERRTHSRHAVHVSARLSTDETGSLSAVTRNLSVGGTLVTTEEALEAGQSVSLTLWTPIPQQTTALTVKGTVVRASTIDENNFLWRYEAAIQFDAPVDVLAPVLRSGAVI